MLRPLPTRAGWPCTGQASSREHQRRPGMAHHVNGRLRLGQARGQTLGTTLRSRLWLRLANLVCVVAVDLRETEVQSLARGGAGSGSRWGSSRHYCAGLAFAPPGLEYDQRLGAGDTAASAQPVDYCLQLLDAVDADADQRVGIACDSEHLLDFGQLGRDVDDLGQVEVAGKAEFGDRLDHDSCTAVVDPGGVSGDHAEAFQPLDPAVD